MFMIRMPSSATPRSVSMDVHQPEADDVHDQDAEQRNPAQRVDGRDPILRLYRSGRDLLLHHPPR